MKKLTSKFLASLLVAGFAWLALGAHAQSSPSVKIGYINTDRIFKEANIAKAAQTKLEQEFANREKALVAEGDALKGSIERFERDAPTLAASVRESRQKTLVDQDQAFQAKRAQFQQDLTNRKNEELQTVLERANRIMRDFAEAEKYDFILQEVAYVNPKLDLTDRVIQALNAAR